MRSFALRHIRAILIAIPAVFLLTAAVYFLPPVRERVDTRVELLEAEIKYAISPPEEAVFVPQEQVDQVALMVTATLQALLAPSATSTPLPEATATPIPEGPTATPTASPPPTASPTPLPEVVTIDGIEYQHQHGLWNYCGPANLAMAVSYWGWQTDRLEAGGYLRGGRDRGDDKNVMPYEMQNFVHEQTGLRMVFRPGGDVQLVKSLVAAGFPVILEKDFFLDGIGWMGHYLLINGYDEAKGEFISQDTYTGADSRYSYETVKNSWRAFNYTFLVAYPPEKEAELFDALGPWVDEAWANQHAFDIASEEVLSLTGRDRYFAWFNRGTNLVALQDYAGAASSYDSAFGLYAELPSAERPWRIMWYQTGPYWAYYYNGRYFDVLNLADTTLDAMTEPILEESFYWRALAKEAVGDWEGAIEDMEQSVTLNPNFGPGIDQLARMRNGG